MSESIERAQWAERLGGGVATLLGTVLAVTPVALWIAWNVELVVCIMLGAAVCAMLLSFVESSLPVSPDQGHDAGTGARTALPEEFIEEVHRLFPLTYHHSMRPATRFQQAMERLSRLIGASRPGDTPR
jgi:hypothetical protein